MDYSKLNNIAASVQDVENAASIVENRLTDLNKKTDELNESVIKLDNNNNLIINPKSEVESTAKNSLIGGIATVGKGEYAFGFGGNTQKVYVSGNASDGYQLQVNVTNSFNPTNWIRPLFENIYKDTYLLNGNTYEKVAKITAVTPNVDDQKISITLDTDLGTLSNTLYRLENISKDKSFNFGVFGNTGDWSSILGYGSYNTGDYSNIIGSNNHNLQTYSTLIGAQNVNTGNYSTLIGINNKATAGNYPFAIGRKNVISSSGYLFGFDNFANTTSTAFLFGQKLICENSRSGFYIGQYNKEYISNDASIANWFAVGCGDPNSPRQNGIEIKQNLDTYVYGVGGFTGANSDSSSVKPISTVISGLETKSTNNDTAISTLQTTVSNLSDKVDSNELVTASSLNDLNDNINSLQESIDDLNENVNLDFKDNLKIDEEGNLVIHEIGTYEIETTKKDGFYLSNDYYRIYNALTYDPNSSTTTQLEGYTQESLRQLLIQRNLINPDYYYYVVLSENGGSTLLTDNKFFSPDNHDVGFSKFTSIETNEDGVVEFSDYIEKFNNDGALVYIVIGLETELSNNDLSDVTMTYEHLPEFDKYIAKFNLNNGDLYLPGIGNYTVKNPSDNISSVQKVLNSSSSSSSSGYITYSTGQGYSIGDTTTASGENSFAEGADTTASGDYSHAEGYYTQTTNTSEHAEGKFNVSNSNTISSIGIGSTSNDRKNAFEVLNNGNIYVTGLGRYNGTSINNVDSLQNVIKNIPVKCNDVYGVEVYTRTPFKNTALSSESIAAGMKSVSVQSGCTTFGAYTYAIGAASLAQGCSSIALGAYSHAEGCSTDGTRYLSEDTRYAENIGNSHYSVALAKNYNSGSRYIYTEDPVDPGYLLTELNVKGNYAGDSICLLENFSYDDYGLKRTRLVRSCEWDSENEAFKLDIGEDGFDVSISKPHTLYFVGGAFGAASHSEGYRTAAYGEFSHSQGEGTIAFGDNSCVVGKYNFASSDDLFAVGNGTGNWDKRSNALVVKSNGNVYIKGIGGYNGINSNAQGIKSVQQVIADLTQQIAALSNN